MESDAEIFGPYRLGKLLGRGGMGEVYRAYDTEQRRTVALKRLAAHLADDPEFEQRFRREAYHVARLRSPHVIPIHRYGEIDRRLYIDMRFVEGGDLANLIHATGPLAPARAVNIVEQLASALDEAHANGLVHRDVKPSNALLDATVTDFCYLADFGITRTATTHRSNSLTRTGAILGSLGYMAPEQFDGAVTKLSDIYSLTCLFFELLTGRKPYEGDRLSALMHAHMKVAPPFASSINPAAAPFDEIITTGMAKEAAARFDSAGALAQAARTALERYRATDPAVRPDSPPPQPTDTSAVILPAHSEPLAPPDPGQSSVPDARDDADTTEPGTQPDAATEPRQSVDGPPARAGRRLLLPVGAAALIVALLATTWAVVASPGIVNGTPTTATFVPLPPTNSVAPSSTPQPAISEAVFTGRSSGNEMTIAVGVKDGRAAGYICDGKKVEAWLEGEISENRLTLHGRDASNGVTATVNQQALLGSVTEGGTTLPFSAQLTTGQAGLYQSRRVVDGITTRIGWIVLPDGTQVGIRNNGGTRTPAPPLNPATTQARDGGQTIQAERVSGATTVI